MFYCLSYLFHFYKGQILCRRNSFGFGTSAFQRHCLPGLETGKHPHGWYRQYQSDWFRNGQDHQEEWSCHVLLWDSGVSRTGNHHWWGTCQSRWLVEFRNLDVIFSFILFYFMLCYNIYFYHSYGFIFIVFLLYYICSSFYCIFAL